MGKWAANINQCIYLRPRSNQKNRPIRIGINTFVDSVMHIILLTCVGWFVRHLFKSNVSCHLFVPIARHYCIIDKSLQIANKRQKYTLLAFRTNVHACDLKRNARHLCCSIQCIFTDLSYSITNIGSFNDEDYVP